MARIRIEDLPMIEEISGEQLKGIFGGFFAYSGFTGGVREPAYQQRRRTGPGSGPHVNTTHGIIAILIGL